ncbi:hypothetical protein Tco_0826017 [Tanacetum coccineum]
MTKTKSFNKNTKHKAFYHALMESILEDEDAMYKGVTDRLKKRDPDDADRDEGPLVGPDNGLKRKKTSKDVEPSKKAKSYVELEYNMEECYKALNDQLDWNNLEGDRYPFDLRKPLPLVQSRNHQIVPVDYFFNNDLAYLQGGSTGRTYMTSLTKTKATEYDLLFNLKGEYMMHLAAALCMFMRHMFERNRLICSLELYKFNDGTLISGRDKLKDMINNLEIGYTSVMPRRRWSNLEKKRSRIMVKDIDRQLLERRLMRSLEKFVGGREYGEDLRLLQRII